MWFLFVAVAGYDRVIQKITSCPRGAYHNHHVTTLVLSNRTLGCIKVGFLTVFFMNVFYQQDFNEIQNDLHAGAHV